MKSSSTSSTSSKRKSTPTKAPSQKRPKISKTEFRSSFAKLLLTFQQQQHSASTNFSDGAMEALQLCHTHFLSLIASELSSSSQQQSEENGKSHLINDIDVSDCMRRLGFGGILEEAIAAQCEEENHSKRKSGKRSSASSKKGKFKITKEMMKEQERLLSQSAKLVSGFASSNVQYSVDGGICSEKTKNGDSDAVDEND